jgi:biopolymer transport protein ExbB/TolQ
MDTKLFLDIVVIILLATSIISMIVINRRLNQLRENRDELPRLLIAFNDATARAEAGIPKLRRAIEDAQTQLQEKVDKAQILRDDLAFMIERADKIANQLEGAVRQARDDIKQASTFSQTVNSEIVSDTIPSEVPYNEAKSEAERELLQALQAMR